MLKWLKKTALWIFAVPLLSLYIGAGLNQIVLVANHDRFPVMWNTYKAANLELAITKAAEKAQAAAIADPSDEDAADAAIQTQFDLAALEGGGYLDDTHVLMTSKTHLNFLADWIDLKAATYSPGDLLIDLGDAGLKYAPIVWACIALSKLSKREERY